MRPAASAVGQWFGDVLMANYFGEVAGRYLR